MEGERSSSFDEFVATRWTRLVRSVVLLGLDLHAAEDAVQSALVRSYQSWDRLSAAEDPDAYVFGILLNVVRASRRRRWNGEIPVAVFPDAGGSDTADGITQGVAVLDAVRSLPRGQREVVVLRFYADYSEQKTADLLGVPVGTVKSRTSRALAALATRPGAFMTERSNL